MKDAIKVGYAISTEDFERLRLIANAYTGGNRSRALRVSVRKFLEYLDSLCASKYDVHAFIKNASQLECKPCKLVIWIPEELSLNLGMHSNYYDVSINRIIRTAIRFGYNFSDQINWHEE